MIKAKTFLAVIDGLEAAATLWTRMQPAAAKLRQMVAEDREPTNKEWDEIMAEGQDDFDAIMNS